MVRISQKVLANFLKANVGWQVNQGVLEKKFFFQDFKTAINFINKIALVAEKVNHHPDLQISYNKVVVRLMTHSVNAITIKDIDLAKKIDKLS
jgi:4a-hydroxytetrahydrobiopterin dehydratase